MSSRCPRVTMTHVARRRDRQLRKHVFVLLGVGVVGFRKTLRVGEGFAVVDDDGGESGQVGDLRNALRNMAAAENVGARLRHHRLDENVQLTSADQPVVVGGVLAQAERQVFAASRFRSLRARRSRPRPRRSRRRWCPSSSRPREPAAWRFRSSEWTRCTCTMVARAHFCPSLRSRTISS